MENCNLIFEVPVFRKITVHVLARDGEEARRIAEECVQTNSFLMARNQTGSVLGYGVPCSKDRMDELERSGEKVYACGSRNRMDDIRRVLIESGFDRNLFKVQMVPSSKTYCIRFYDTVDSDRLDAAMGKFGVKPKSFTSIGFDGQKRRFTQVLLKFDCDEDC